MFLDAKIVGGLQMVDQEEADDKMIAVLENDNVWGGADDLADLPEILVERLRHYFETYKLVPGEASNISIQEIYGCQQALNVVNAALSDYEQEFGQ